MTDYKTSDRKQGRGLYLRQFVSSCTSLGLGLCFSPLKLFGLVVAHFERKDTFKLGTPAIFASNHRNAFDPFYIVVAFFPFITFKFMPFAAYAAPLHRLQQRPMQRISKKIGLFQAVYFFFNVVQIPEKGTLTDKIMPLVMAVRGGESALIFPEGRSVSHGDTRPFKNGVAKLYMETKAPIIPCAIYYYKKRFLKRTIICIGEAVTIPDSIYQDGGLEAVAEEIRRLVDVQYRKCIQFANVK